MTSAIASPCIKVCAVEPQSGICLGCYRTLPEIAGWGRMTPEAREVIMADLATRASRLPAVFQPKA
ncbi:MAG: DUF1289 domain-containing protein [Hyphomonadaceae bacterium]|jgi:hypothetical protein|nr:DUF1289 domain-containing protein [Hyphomonadaceae bacterium]